MNILSLCSVISFFYKLTHHPHQKGHLKRAAIVNSNILHCHQRMQKKVLRIQRKSKKVAIASKMSHNKKDQGKKVKMAS